MTDYKYVDILLIEDNSGDIRLICDALEKTYIKPGFSNVKNGVSAMQFLRREAPFEDAPRPRIIMLDLNLPGMDGRDLLKRIKSDAALALIPVIVFSGSDAPKDILACYGAGANCYIVKPRDLPGFTETIHKLADFWLRQVTLPPV